ncbi:SsgA family sporulation/cell division regulator [Kutzneria sp. CA-103260]|uniref:SsgA family sporulation/cell division regulator n=1 Tax=Kutzneria sp. CA-103260 TaxID=2802641 RepID=UPI001BAB4AEF|nr:SsgA family sporulation/cell division regulator [Kutzneria sp. CA-103260]QUQ66087.1 sporulation and cell division protein SsgA [Kutzneria sp. CA-103260]
MSTAPVIIEVETVMGLRGLLGGAVPVPAALRYDPSDPYAVTATFHHGQGEVSWIFARDLLADGLLAPSGDGDLHINPVAGSDMVLFVLTSPDGAAVMEASAGELADFLDLSYDQVPPGAEWDQVDFDRELAALATPR